MSFPECDCFRTEAYDDLKPPGEDPRWDIFEQFHQYLERRFPLVYVHFNLHFQTNSHETVIRH